MKKDPFLYIAAFIMDTTFSLVGLSVPLLALHLGASYKDLGSLGAIGAFTYTLSCLITGRLSDQIGYRYSLTVSSFVVGILFLFYTTVTKISEIFILFPATFVFLSGFFPPLQAWLGQNTNPKFLMRTLGFFNCSWSFGVLIGSALGGHLYEIHHNFVFFYAQV